MFKKIALPITLGLFAFSAFAQAPAQTTAPETQPFGKINQADIDMKACDFEKGTNAMVLFNKGVQYYDQNLNVVLEYHKRIKIFNANGEGQAKIRLEYYGGNRLEYITGLQAETINAGADGKPEITKLDKKQIFTEQVDKEMSAMVFTFPNVRPGSVIEYKYTLTINSYSYIPTWFFQDEIPVRYSEFSTSVPDFLLFNTKSKMFQQLSKHTTSVRGSSIGSGENAYTFSTNDEVRAMSNLHSLPDEPYTGSSNDNLESVHYILTSVRPVGVMQHNLPDTWAKVGGTVADADNFGAQLKRKLSNEEAIVSRAKALKTDDEKIACIFDEVRNDMKWDGRDRCYTNDGTKAAWEKKTGNATEINLILCHLLMQAGVKAYPMIVSTHDNGRINPSFPFLYQFNRGVAYVPVDSTHHYILDASDKYNVYNEAPSNLLNSYGLYIDKAGDSYDLVFLQQQSPVNQSVYIVAQISDKGKMDGTAQISCNSYSRLSAVKSYKKDGEKKYIDYLRGGNNALTVSGLKMENMEVDTLPLKESIDFKSDLTASDDKYIYFSPNMFTALNSNPFISDTRYTDVDFGYKKMYTVIGTFKLPAGYQVDALPKNISMMMPDNSITFKRLVAVQDGSLMVRYLINYNQSIYFKENYPELHEFHKKVQEMINEQIVLKKG